LKQRLFIALDPPDDLRQEIVDLQSRLDQLRLPLRFEPAEKLHLTLNFLGEVDKSFTSDIGTALKSVASEFSPFILTPAFLETLYQRHDNSLVYLGFTGDVDILKKLQSGLKACLSGMHLPQPKRFLPHITLGKMIKTDPVLTKSALDKVRDFKIRPLSEFTIDHLTLYESLLSKEGSHYRRLRRFMLK
jgi:RNA 2',3'-cyclic 3'-phosphodiesterase